MEGISWKTKRKGYWLFRNGKLKKEVDTPKRTHFTVLNDNENRQVIHDKIKDSWSCDCRFYALKFKDCSHITACKLFVRDEDAG